MDESARFRSQSEFFRMFVSHEAELKNYARVLLSDWDAVDDVFQSASMVMWSKLDSLEDESGFLPWAKVIVRIECFRHRRTRGHDRLIFDDELVDLLAKEDNGDRCVRRKSLFLALEKCLDRLSLAHRELVLAPHRGRGSVLTLAEQSKRTVNSLYKQIGRLRTIVGECVEKQLAEKGEVL